MPVSARRTAPLRRVLNPVMLRVAGHGGSLVVLEHVGRRTGTVRRTPLMAFRHGGTVTVALTYGPDVAWLANIRAAGRCRMLLGGTVLRLGAPREVPPQDALPWVPLPQRALLRWPIRCRDFVELPVLGPR
ncbi:nitroreductase family deazaflavin-dependent oxidoreductase [Cellulomonas sp. Marseille-Q8402]